MIVVNIIFILESVVVNKCLGYEFGILSITDIIGMEEMKGTADARRM